MTKQRKLDKIEADPELAEDTISDHNNVDFLMNTTHCLKITELVVIILNISYFVGILFLIVSQVNLRIGRLIDEEG